MAKEIKSVFVRSSDTIVSDLIGVLSLGVILYAGLALPALF
jgi:hypothetical protein